MSDGRPPPRTRFHPERLLPYACIAAAVALFASELTTTFQFSVPGGELGVRSMQALAVCVRPRTSTQRRWHAWVDVAKHLTSSGTFPEMTLCGRGLER